ncbi:hypothetical protein [Paenibacillus sp. V4I5]|uniref:hypothetical protein n=1 Tax=Paenibacillus sp. V4I5 TaxID=3042306 RepID=UPI00278E3832|nr:hypothetical protein [Paenibacillus sp. V4I5]MDQ0917539.1 hypothetical protein [Paenibacillus sp. V4I5]
MSNLPNQQNNNEVVKRERQIHGGLVYRNLSDEEAAKLDEIAEKVGEENNLLVNIFTKKTFIKGKNQKELEE